MKNRLFILIGLTICLACSKKNHIITSTPHSNMQKNKVYMKEGIILNVQPQTSKAKIRDNIVYFDRSCIFMGLGSEIDFAIINPQFDPFNLPAPFKIDFYKSKGLYLFTHIEFADPINPRPDIPFWVSKMPDLVFIRFERVKLGNIAFLERLNLKHLMLIDVEFSDHYSVIKQISKLKTLEFLVSDNLFSKDELNFLKKQLPGLTFLSKALYDEKVDNDEIRYPYGIYERK